MPRSSPQNIFQGGQPFMTVQCMLVINQVTGFGSRRDRSEDPYAGNKGMRLLLVSMHIPGRLSPNTCILHASTETIRR